MATKTVQVALVLGDGAAPEMMVQAVRVVETAAALDSLRIEFIETPMGWNAYERGGDTLPARSLAVATQIGTLFFGGVGDPDLDETIGSEHPDQRPEAKVLLTIRKQWGLLLNFRPIIYYPELRDLTRLRPDLIPDQGIEQIFVRYLLEDSYFGVSDLFDRIDGTTRTLLGIKRKAQVTGEEEMITEVSYYTAEGIARYFTAVFELARQKGLPVICVDKSNIMPRYVFWRKIATRIGSQYSDVELRFQYADSANALLFSPTMLHGVIACGNEQVDILSDGAAAAMASLGMMCSSAINPQTDQAMFESGAGTAPTLAGKNVANPIGRILSGALMLRHLGALKGAAAIERAVRQTLADGLRTADIAQHGHAAIGTVEMTDAILARLG